MFTFQHIALRYFVVFQGLHVVPHQCGNFYFKGVIAFMEQAAYVEEFAAKPFHTGRFAVHSHLSNLTGFA